MVPNRTTGQNASGSPKKSRGLFRKVRNKDPSPPPAVLNQTRLPSSLHSQMPNANLLRLRDACQCSRCVDPDSGQKTFATTHLPNKPELQSAEFDAGGSLTVVWENDPLSGGGTHESVYTPEFIERWKETSQRKLIPRVLWDRAMLEEELDSCRVSYDDWMAGGDKFRDAFIALHKTGVIFVNGVPESETSVEEIGRQIGRLQDTFYGLTWDVISKPQAENVAYTNQFLGLHQDLLYYFDCPRIQLLHCIANDCDGGESLFSDGVRTAMQLQLQSPDQYATLTNENVSYHYDRNGHLYGNSRPTIRDSGAGFVPSVWWSPPFQDVFSSRTKVNRWHRAAGLFQRTLEAPENLFEYKMRPGECVVFDNWRVLHGRRHFNTAQGKRWLKGTYVSNQVFQGRTSKLLAEFDSHQVKESSHDMWAAEKEALDAQLGGSREKGPASEEATMSEQAPAAGQ